jgi:biopolymer transport protein ExbB
MRKGFWLKTFILVIALTVVLVVIVTTRHQFSRGQAPAEISSGVAGQAETRTFFTQFVISGGPIVWFVLLPMSFVMVFLAVEHGLTIRRKKLLPSGIGERIVEIIRQFGPRQLMARIADRSDFVSIAVVKAVAQGKGDWFRMRSLLAESLQEQAGGLLRRIEWLNLIGNVSPMVGLFGTVFGMIKLFNAIVTAGGQPQPAQLADGISVALVTTFWGLFIAIPALAVHGVFRNRIETLANDAVVEAENIVPEIRRSLEQNRAEKPKRKQPIQEFGGKAKGTVGESQPLRKQSTSGG